MEIMIEQRSNIKVIIISGELTSDNVNLFKEKVYPEFYNSLGGVAINMGSISHIDSTGIGSLVGAIKIAKSEKKDFILFDMPLKVQKFFDDIGLQSFFKILSLKEFEQKYR